MGSAWILVPEPACPVRGSAIGGEEQIRISPDVYPTDLSDAGRDASAPPLTATTAGRPARCGPVWWGQMDVFSDQLFVLRMSLGDGTMQITVVGDLDTSRTATFREVVAVPKDGVRLLELDLARVTFLDAAGVREVIRLQRTAMRDGYQLLITAASDAVRVVLTALNRGDMLPAGPTALPTPAGHRWVE
jgi:anti-anti-sigma factor